jgi:protein-S-isoprenylcysteine O-methyltransferase Ste14
MRTKLFLNAIIKTALGIILVGLLLFLPAGTLAYAGAWRFIALTFVPMLLIGAVMLCKSPELLEKRLDSQEKLGEQRLAVAFAAVLFIVGFVVAGGDFRFALSRMPEVVSICACVTYLTGYVLYAEVLRENTYLSRTIEVSEGQTVIDTGLYGIVRHPMYSVTLLLFLTIPLVLGSLYGFLVFLAYPFIIATRIRGEERFLEAELDGYCEYKTKVKYRLIPFVW